MEQQLKELSKFALTHSNPRVHTLTLNPNRRGCRCGGPGAGHQPGAGSVWQCEDAAQPQQQQIRWVASVGWGGQEDGWGLGWEWWEW